MPQNSIDDKSTLVQVRVGAIRQLVLVLVLVGNWQASKWNITPMVLWLSQPGTPADS